MRSEDNGLSWQQLPAISNGSSLTNLCSDPTNGKLLVEDSNSGSIYNSSDLGNTWEKVGGLSANYFMSSTGMLFGVTGTALMVSEDDGYSWGNVAGIPTGHYNLAGNSNGYIYIWNASYAYYSNNGGGTWQSTGLPQNGLFGVDKKNVLIGYNSSYYLTSSDNGNTWIQKGQLVANGLMVNDTDNNLYSTNLNSGVYKSEDEATSWQLVGLPTSNASSIVSPEPNWVIANSEFITTNGGNTWRTMNPPFQPTVLSFDSSKNAFAGSSLDRIYESTDQGTSWELMGSALPDSSTSATLTKVLSTGSGTIFAAKYPNIYKSTNWGNTWANILTSYGPQDLYLDLYTGKVLDCDYNFLSVTSDMGNSWHQMTDPPPNPWSGQTQPIRKARILRNGYIVGNTAFGLYVSSDNGNTWSFGYYSLFGPQSDTLVSDFSVNASDEIFAEVGSTIVSSDDYGRTWHAIYTDPSSALESISIDPDGFLFVGDINGILKSKASTLRFVDDDSLNFGPVIRRDTVSKQVTFYNNTISPLIIDSIQLPNGDLKSSFSTPYAVSTNDSVAIPFSYSPSKFGSFADTISIVQALGVVYIEASGQSPYPVIQLSRISIGYGTVAVRVPSVQAVTVKDSSINTLRIDTIYTRTKEFTVNIGHGCVTGTDSLMLNVTFTPDSVGTFIDTLSLRNNSLQRGIRIPMSGSSPYPIALLNKSLISFSSAVLGTTYRDSTMVKDSSINPMTINTVYTLTKWFTASLTKKSCGLNDSLYVGITFIPDSTRSYYDTLYITNNSQKSTIKLPLSGNVPPPLLNVPTSSLSLAQVSRSDSSTMNIEILNSSINSLTVTALTTKTTAFHIATQLPLSVSGNDSAKVHIVFSPISFGSFLDTLAIISNGGSAKIPLSGSSPYPQITVSNQSFSFSAKVGQPQSKILKITNGSINALIVDSVKTFTKYFTLSGMTLPDTIRRSDTSSVSIAFSPDSVRNYADTLYTYTNADTSLLKTTLAGSGEIPSGITREGDDIPTIYELYQNYPNPSNPSTTIKFALPQQSRVSVTIYDILARKVKELVNNKLQPGYYQFTWNASGYASGVYFYRIVAQSLSDQGRSFVQAKKLVLIK
jgi:photosystem II stability/assembly factor-like uncharacterized protein